MRKRSHLIWLYEKFEKVVAVQTTREVAELTYAKQVVLEIQNHPLLGEYSPQLHFYPMTTREQSEYMGRITTHLVSGKFCEWTGLPSLNFEEDRLMICGSVAMLKEIKDWAIKLGFIEGANNSPASFVIEKAFVD